ncbi:hypothetical protein ACW4YW_00490 [Methylobacillus pratensis]
MFDYPKRLYYPVYKASGDYPSVMVYRTEQEVIMRYAGYMDMDEAQHHSMNASIVWFIKRDLSTHWYWWFSIVFIPAITALIILLFS